MKAKQLKNGSWTISGVSSETIVAVSKVLDFAHDAELHYCHNIGHLQSLIDDIRKDYNTLALISRVITFTRCISDDIKNRS